MDHVIDDVSRLNLDPNQNKPMACSIEINNSPDGEQQKRHKIASNYETIAVLREQLDERLHRERVGMSRTAYIKMILDVSAKVNKQNDVLNKVVLDIRGLQKDIGTLGGQLGRSYASAECAILQVCFVCLGCCFIPQYMPRPNTPIIHYFSQPLQRMPAEPAGSRKPWP